MRGRRKQKERKGKTKARELERAARHADDNVNLDVSKSRQPQQQQQRHRVLILSAPQRVLDIYIYSHIRKLYISIYTPQRALAPSKKRDGESAARCSTQAVPPSSSYIVYVTVRAFVCAQVCIAAVPPLRLSKIIITRTASKRAREDRSYNRYRSLWLPACCGVLYASV